jgi:vanillate O-demethylase ferredoxin subunit
MTDELRLSVRVAARRDEAEGIVSFELVSVTNEALPAFSAGAHIDVEVAPGVVRQYSLCNNPHDRERYEIGVLRDPNSRGGSIALHQFQEGECLRISAPRNHFELHAGAERSLLFAGGIGVTPILCMAERLAAIGADFRMFYGARSLARCAFRNRILKNAFADRVSFHFDDGDASQKLDLAGALGAPTPGTHVYVCGPSGFIHAVQTAAVRLGFSDSQLHREYFAADKEEMFADGGAFELRLASTGVTLSIPGNRTVLDVLREHGVKVPTSCEQGVCGACLTRVLEGIPEHRDFYLTNDERAVGNQFLPCCSRSKTPVLIVDL